MEARDKYQHWMLTESTAIRLIVLQPALNLEDQIRCNLIHTTLADCEDDVINQYTAISYVWGDPTDVRTILVDGKTMEITATLDSALRHIRSCDHLARFWADAICIDQSNVEERNQQVRQMASVYECANHTIIYLGPAIREAEELLHLLRRSNAKFKKDYVGDLETSGLKERWHKAEGYLLTRPWLTRIWVLQELVFSRDPWVQCGLTRTRWDHFCKHMESRSAISDRSGVAVEFLLGNSSKQIQEL